MDQEQPQNTLRETLEANVEASEAGTLPTLEQSAEDSRARDEAGRFARKQEQEAQVHNVEVTPAPQGPQRPTTWKKDYLPIWDKLASGQPLLPDEARKVADYTTQRENEYKTGVSTYKAEAMQAREVHDAITPYIPELQANGLRPGAWIKSMADAHYALYKGTPEVKLQVFQALARQFNIPLGMLGQGAQQAPSLVTDLLGQIDQLKQQVNGVTNWRHQQETGSLMGEISKVANDSANYPHFNAVRETMAQLLETGLAQDLPTAYAKAIWMNDEVRGLEQQRLSGQSSNANAVAKAKARAISPKSATPSSIVAGGGNKDRRAVLESAFDSLGGGRV